MEQIKFKAWIPSRKEMRDNICCIRGKAFVYNEVTLQALPLNGAVLIQFCNFEDRGGKSFDWWEGDILQLDKEQYPDDPTSILVIVRKDGCFKVQHYDHGKPYVTDEKEELIVECNYWTKDSYVKIGSIYDNPELLKQ